MPFYGDAPINWRDLFSRKIPSTWLRTITEPRALLGEAMEENHTRMAHPVVLLVFWTAFLLALDLADWRMERYVMHWSFYYERLSAQDAELFERTIGLPKELGPNPNWYETEQQISQKLKELDKGLDGRSVVELLYEKGKGALAGRYADLVWREELKKFSWAAGQTVYLTLLVPLCAWIVHRILDCQGRSYQQTLAVYIIWWTFWSTIAIFERIWFYLGGIFVLIDSFGFDAALQAHWTATGLMLTLLTAHLVWLFRVSHGAGLGWSVFAVSVAMAFFAAAIAVLVYMYFMLDFLMTDSEKCCNAKVMPPLAASIPRQGYGELHAAASACAAGSIGSDNLPPIVPEKKDQPEAA
ncbi:MAG: hypothetical protein OEV92_02130 [Nitrospinota bacterium]|nr:hypothetical protein [Nitrospinota bacterium]